MSDWVSFDQAKLALGLDPADTADDEWLQLCVDGVNRLIDDTRNPPDVVPPDARVTWGGIQLATRWYSRRNSNDISAFVEFGGPPPALDRDIEIALKINRYYGPAVA